ncbi:MAG: hypothetical protein J2P24_18900 [Streptosporangiales bacterium]|nr:hypothetical protein [Streptosporangiales bacterium]
MTVEQREYDVENGYVVAWGDHCTCGGSGIYSHPHLPGCGSEPVGPVDQVVADCLAILKAAGWDRLRFTTLYRSRTPDGAVWCESRDPDDIRRHPHPTEPLTYEQLVTYNLTAGWEPWAVAS